MEMINAVPLEVEINNNPQLRIADIEILRKWCVGQPHLPKIPDKDLALFLHSNYYCVEKTVLTIEIYFTIRSQAPEFFSNRDPLEAEDIRQSMKVGANIQLKGTTNEGYDVLLTKLIDSVPSKYNFNGYMKHLTMVTDFCLHSKPLALGHVLLIDMSGFSFSHAGKLNWFGMKTLFSYLQEGLPVRLQAIHVFNASSVLNLLLNMIKPFVKTGLIDLIFIHSSLDSLAKYMNIDMLPDECGGKAGPLITLHDETTKCLEENRDWFLYDQENNRVNEALRPEKGKNSLGVVLEID